MKNLHPVYFVFLSILHGFVFAPPKYPPSPKHAIQPVASFTAPTISIQSGTFQTITVGPVTGAEICQGQSLVLEATASPTPFRYNWYLDASYIGTGNTISVNQEGDYTARAADASNVEGADSAPITVFVNQAPAQLSIQCTGSASFCNSTPITLNAQLNTGQRATYQWFLNGSPVATGPSYSTNVAGNYTVQATNYCGNLTSPVVTLNQVTAPPTGLSVSAAGGATQICSGDNILLSTTLSSGSSVGYQWYLNSLASPISGATNSTYSATAAGNYLVQAFNGCGTVQSSYNLTGGSAPTSTTLLNTSPTLACQGTSVVLNATQVGANILGYEWYRDGVLVRNTTISSALFTQSGLYTVRAFNNCGPSPISNAVTVGIVSPPQNTSFTF
ncbi:MAG TPA: hypothetical protein DCM08_00400, partial [Microscillaceae bacterium]|nr:hypothetical protein [Microscillaceae bacterium]